MAEQLENKEPDNDNNSSQQLESKEAEDDEDSSPYSLTIAIIREKLSIHLHDKNSKNTYHESFTTNALCECGFSETQSANLEGISNIIADAKKGHNGIQFVISIEQNENTEMPDVGVIRMSKDDESFGTKEYIMKLNQLRSTTEDSINDDDD